MNQSDKRIIRNRNCLQRSFSPFFALVILFLASCSGNHDPYSIIGFTGADVVNNYSRSLMLMGFESDSTSPGAVPGSSGDLFSCDEKAFIYKNASYQDNLRFKLIDNVFYVNDKIISIDIPGNDTLFSWSEKIKGKDLSALQFLNFGSEIKESDIPYLTELAKIRPDAGISFEGNFSGMAGLLNIYDPQYIVGPAISRSDYDQLARLNKLKILMVSLKDSIITDPLPAIPELEQLFLTNTGENATLGNDFLANNKQIKRVIMWNPGSFNFSILNPLENLNELVVSGADTLINPELINNHKNLELLSLTGDKVVYNIDLITLQNLRWMAFSSNVTQEEFSTFAVNHPNLEMVEIIKNGLIHNLRPLAKLRNLYGLTVVDTVTDISTIRTLTNLKFLSLPADLLKDTVYKGTLQNSLPGVRIVANEGFCLGSGWLLLIIPLVPALRFFTRHKKNKLLEGAKS